jgi:sigma-B regulation protein RsbU (phosphoserine phosphatase)
VPPSNDIRRSDRLLPRVGPARRAPLFETLAGRLLILSSALFLVLFVLQQLVELPDIAALFRRVLLVAALAAAAWIGGAAIVRNRRAFLWRVRRKLVLSYVFLGFVPLVLVGAFVLTGAMLVYMMIANYVFRESFGDLVTDVHLFAETSSIELARPSVDAVAAIERKYANLSSEYPNLSLAVVPVAGREGGPTRLITAGPWSHGPPPETMPAWVVLAERFSGTLVQAPDEAGRPPALIIRSAVLTPDGRRAVVADLPVDDAIVGHLQERTGARLREISATGCGAGTADLETDRSLSSLFSETVSFMDCHNWADGTVGALSLGLDAPLSDLTSRLAAVGGTDLAPRAAAAPLSGSTSWWTVFVNLLLVLGGLLLVIWASALVMGSLLVRSITYAVHELFVGTERIQQGDFAHRIRIESGDQLEDLAGSFNRMSASIDHLLLVQREKQRLDDELRIARQIQKSLLPVAPPRLPGLDLADLCEPAREVGGDYYDFFPLGPRQLAVLIADVSGKGTSAALYMAELKGLMLALSRADYSPRRVLIEVNRHLADHLDNRSFVTMTYAVIDLEQRTLTAARAGHTPILIVSGGRSEVVTPDGMVLGLRLPGASERFEAVLAEHTQPLLPGDVIVLYTDGITEAMDATGELFGDAALARLVAAQHDRDAAGIRERVVRDVRAFVGEAEPHDDMTMVVLKIEEEAA